MGQIITSTSLGCTSKEDKGKEMLTVQVGQCGNQLGHALFQKLAEESNECTTFFRPSVDEFGGSDRSIVTGTRKRIARAVLIDMEPKVIQRCQTATLASSNSETTPWEYEKTNVFTKQSGSGNNWAHGYMGHGTQTENALLELLQTETERCDFLHGFLTLQSVAGGTGSGLGSFVNERLADFYPSCSLFNAVVWPYDSGEVIVQNYNAVLTMSSLSSVSNGIFVLCNDTANAICQRLLRMPRPSFEEMNAVLATQLASAFLPVGSTDSTTQQDSMSMISEHLCQHPGYKLLDIKTIPLMPQRSKKFSTHTWMGILKHLHQMHIADSALEEGIDWNVSLDKGKGFSNCSLGSLLLLRGKEATQADVAAFADPRMYVDWNIDPFKFFVSKRNFNAYDKSATLISNSQAMIPTLASTTEKAHQMFSHGAYLHQYQRHGIDKSYFQQAFLHIDQVIHNYQTLSSNGNRLFQTCK